MKNTFAVLLIICLGMVLCAEFLPAEEPNLEGYKPISKAEKFKFEKSDLNRLGKNSGRLGIRFEWKKELGPVVLETEIESAASKAGIKKGDILLSILGKKITDIETLRLFLMEIRENDKVKVLVKRDTAEKEFELLAIAWSNPLTNQPKTRLGISLQPDKNQTRLEVKSIIPGSPAEKAGVKTGDIVIAVNGKKLTSNTSLSNLVEVKKAGDILRMTVQRENKPLSLEVRLDVDLGDEAGKSWNDRDRKLFKKPAYKLAIVLVEFPDQKLNEKIKASDWESAIFSSNSFNDKNATGQKVYGSMNDFYAEISEGKCKIEGKVFAPISVEKKRMEYAAGSPRTAILDYALSAILTRDGEKALQDFDGVFLLYAGARAPVSRGNILWPHRATHFYKGKRYSYFISPEGGDRMSTISVICHEFGHMLGLPDLYARPEVPDMEGLGLWCSMANGAGQEGRPVHFSAWCKEQMEWLTPTLIDPRVAQKLILSPIEGNNSECIKIPVRPDGTEYFLLENRSRKNFDKNLPGEGLLIWRVVDGKPSLEESHGISGPAGPGRFLELVPYPSKSNQNFTPATIPSSTPVKQGGWPLHITHIQKLSDGRIIFQIGFEYY